MTTPPPAGGYPPNPQAPPPNGGGQPGPADDRSSVGLIHLLGGIFGIVIAVIMWAVMKDRSPFADAEGKKALNFQIWITIGYIVSWILTFLIIGIFTWLALWVISIVFGVKNYQAVTQGRQTSYPLENVAIVK